MWGQQEIDVRKLHLTDKEREMLLDRGDVDEIPDSYQASITKRLQLQAKRIQYLIDDLSLLHNAGFLTENHWQTGWEELCELDSRTELRNSGAWMRDAHLHDDLNNERMRFAHHFGQLVRLLHDGLLDPLSPKNRGLANLADGFSVGLLGTSKNEVRGEGENFNRVVGWLREYEIERATQAALDGFKEGFGSSNYDTEIPAETIKGEGYRYTDPLKDELFEREQSLTPPRAFTPEVTKERLKEIESDYRELREVEELNEYLCQDHHQITHTHWKGVQADVIVQFVFDHRSTGWIIGSAIWQGIDEKRKSTVKLLNDMAAIEGHKGWEERPLFLKDDQNKGHRWKLTEYGKLIAYQLTQGNISTELHAFALGRDGCSDKTAKLIGNTLNEVIRE